MPEQAELKVLVSMRDQATQQMQGISKNTQRMNDAFKQMGRAATVAGAAVSAALILAVRQVLNVGEALTDMSDRTGLAIKTLQEFGYAVRLSGGDMNQFEIALRQMQQQIIMAADSTKEEGNELAYVESMLAKYRATANEMPEMYADWTAQAMKLRNTTKQLDDPFTQIGLDIKQLQTLKPEDQFLTVALAVANIQDSTLKAARAMEIFGARTGTELLPILKDGAAGMDAMRKAAQAAGYVLSDEQVAAADKAKKEIQALRLQVEGLTQKLTIALVPIIQKLIPYIEKAVDAFAKWAAENPTWVADMIVLAGSMAAVATALAPFGPMIQVLGAAVVALLDALIHLGMEFGVFEKMKPIVEANGKAWVALANALEWVRQKFIELTGPADTLFNLMAKLPIFELARMVAGSAATGEQGRAEESAAASAANVGAAAPQTIIVQVDGREMARATSPYYAQGAQLRRRMGG